MHANIPRSIIKQTWLGNSLSYSKIITPDSVWPNIHMVEVVRSCPELCRFCLASYLPLPFRTSSLADGLIPAILKGLAVTNRIGLLGASVTQHPEFSDLMRWLDQAQFNANGFLSQLSANLVDSVVDQVTGVDFIGDIAGGFAGSWTSQALSDTGIGILRR